MPLVGRPLLAVENQTLTKGAIFGAQGDIEPLDPTNEPTRDIWKFARQALISVLSQLELAVSDITASSAY